MDYLTPFEISRSGLEAQRMRMSVISSNLANIHTTRMPDGSGPYRRRDVVFKASNMPTFSDILQQKLTPEQMNYIAGSNWLDIAQGESVDKELMSRVEVDKIIEDARPFERVYNPEHPDADKDGFVLMPNISIMEEMTNMISAMRSYQANLSAMKNYKTMTSSTIALLQD